MLSLPWVIANIKVLFDQQGFCSGKQSFTADAFIDIVSSAITGYRDSRRQTFHNLRQYGEGDWDVQLTQIESRIKRTFDYTLPKRAQEYDISRIQCSLNGDVTVDIQYYEPNHVGLKQVLQTSPLDDVFESSELVSFRFAFDMAEVLSICRLENFSTLEESGHHLEQLLRTALQLTLQHKRYDITQLNTCDIEPSQHVDAFSRTAVAIPGVDSFYENEVFCLYAATALVLAKCLYWQLSKVYWELKRLSCEAIGEFDRTNTFIRFDNTTFAEESHTVTMDAILYTRGRTE